MRFINTLFNAKKVLSALVVILCAVVFSAPSFADETPVQYDTTVRVGLFFGETALNSVTVDGTGGFFVQTGNSSASSVFVDVNTLKLSASSSALTVSTVFGAKITSASAGTNIYVFPANPDSTVSVNNQNYRGSFKFYSDTSGKIIVINELDINEYLRGVLPSEIYPSWNMESLKAAAVASRTFALRNAVKSSHSTAGFDICATTHCQMYSGTRKENSRTNEAIYATAYEVLKYNGTLAMTPYHSSGGLYTETASGAWGGSPSQYPYLTTVFTPYEDYRNVSNGKWHYTVNTNELINYVSSTYKSRISGNIADIDITRLPSGFIEKMVVTDTSGKQIQLSNSGTARSFFSSLVKSGNFGITKTYVQSSSPAPVSVISASGTYEMTGINGYDYISASGQGTYYGLKEVYVVDGQGYGHGVGMSQFGSRCLGDAGFTYNEILAVYYPGTVLEPLNPVVEEK